jgi:hypothetical protein
MLIFGLSARSRHGCLREQFYESRLDRKRAGMRLSFISDADAEKSGGPRYESGRPRAIGIGSSISQEAALLIAAAVVAVGVVVARSPVGIADLASVVKSPVARDVT